MKRLSDGTIARKGVYVYTLDVKTSHYGGKCDVTTTLQFTKIGEKSPSGAEVDNNDVYCSNGMWYLLKELRKATKKEIKKYKK